MLDPRDFALPMAFEEFRYGSVDCLDVVIKYYKECYRQFYYVHGAKTPKLLRGQYLQSTIADLEKFRAALMNWPLYSFDMWVDRFTAEAEAKIRD